MKAVIRSNKTCGRCESNACPHVTQNGATSTDCQQRLIFHLKTSTEQTSAAESACKENTLLGIIIWKYTCVTTEDLQLLFFLGGSMFHSRPGSHTFWGYSWFSSDNEAKCWTMTGSFQKHRTQETEKVYLKQYRLTKLWCYVLHQSLFGHLTVFRIKCKLACFTAQLSVFIFQGCNSTLHEFRVDAAETWRSAWWHKCQCQS